MNNLLLKALREKWGDHCQYCGCLLTFKHYHPNTKFLRAPTADHRVPLSKGGTHAWENLILCCRSCNSRKATKTLEEYRPTPDYQFYFEQEHDGK